MPISQSTIDELRRASEAEDEYERRRERYEQMQTLQGAIAVAQFTNSDTDWARVGRWAVEWGFLEVSNE